MILVHWKCRLTQTFALFFLQLLFKLSTLLIQPLKLEKSAETIGAQKAKMIYKTMEEATEKTGNVVTSKGPMTVDDFFAALESIEIPFDDNGIPSFPRMIGSEAASKRLMEIQSEIRDSPKLQERFEGIVKSKRRKWLAGEAARKLVG